MILGLLKLNVKYKQAVQIGDAACIAVDQRHGNGVYLSIATHLPITIIPSGIIPRRFTTGLDGASRIPVPVGNDPELAAAG